MFLNAVSDKIMKALDLTWMGMLSIFIGVFVIYLVIIILLKITNKNKKRTN